MAKRIIVVSGPIYNPYDYYAEVAADNPIAWYQFGSASSLTDSAGTNNGVYTPRLPKFPTTVEADSPTYLDKPTSKSLLLPFDVISRTSTLQYGDVNSPGYIPVQAGVLDCPVGHGSSWSLEFWFRATGDHCTRFDSKDWILESSAFSRSQLWAFGATNVDGPFLNGLNQSLYTRFYFSMSRNIGSALTRDYLASPLLNYKRWQHFVIRYQHSINRLELYIDGVLRDFNDSSLGLSGYTSRSVDPNEKLEIGLNDVGLLQVECNLAHLAYYDYALTQSRILRHFQAAP